MCAWVGKGGEGGSVGPGRPCVGAGDGHGAWGCEEAEGKGIWVNEGRGGGGAVWGGTSAGYGGVEEVRQGGDAVAGGCSDTDRLSQRHKDE